MANKEYEKYKIDWMFEHGYTLADLLAELQKIQSGSGFPINLEEALRIFELQDGFEGDIWETENSWFLNDLDDDYGDLVVRPFKRSDTWNHLEDVKMLDKISGLTFADHAEANWNAYNNFWYGAFYEGECIAYCCIGYAVGYFDDDEDSEVWEHPNFDSHSLVIFDLFVRPDFRDRLVGSEFIKRAIQLRLRDEQELGYDTPSIFATVENEGQKHFFEKNGFKDIGGEKHHYLVLKPEN